MYGVPSDYVLSSLWVKLDPLNFNVHIPLRAIKVQIG